MLTETSALAVPLTHDESATLFGRTMGLVACTAGVFALGAYLGRDSSYSTGWLWLLAGFGCLIALNFAVKRSQAGALALLFGFGLFFGLSLAPTLSHYAAADARSIWQAGAATALFVAGFGAAGYATRRDLSVLARWLFWALVGLIGLGLVLIFVDIPNGSLIYTIIGLVVFAGLTAIDFQRLRRSKDIREAPLLASSIFLDALNVFLFWLTLFSGDPE